jgi:Tetracyclin repressor-like, C-terminal domain
MGPNAFGRSGVEELAMVAKMLGVLFYAVRVFDFPMARPDLMRLMAWFSLEQKADIQKSAAQLGMRKLRRWRRATNAGQVGKAFSPGFLPARHHGVATAWTAAKPFASSLDPNAHKRSTVLRGNIRVAVRFLSESTLVAAELLGTRKPTRATAT